jgi:small subunit ribosomal protein S6
MRKYEVTYFTAPEEKTSAVEDAVKELGGILVSAKDLGARELAYQVGHLKEGQFFEVIFKIDGGKLSELERKIKQDKKVTRFILIKALREKKIKEKKAKSPVKPTEATEPAEPPVKSEIKTKSPAISEPTKPEPDKKEKPATKPTPKPKAKPKVKTKVEKPVKPAKVKKKIEEPDTTSDAELDKKLQELVED